MSLGYERRISSVIVIPSGRHMRKRSVQQFSYLGRQPHSAPWGRPFREPKGTSSFYLVLSWFQVGIC